MLLSIDHITTYRYAEPVVFGPHRLMLRAIEGHDVQIKRSGLEISLNHTIRWQHDVFDNSVALVEFPEPANELRIRSTLLVQQYITNPFDFVLDPQVLELPFPYRPQEQADISPYLLRQFPQDEAAIRQWIRPFLTAQETARTTEFFTTLSKSIPLFFQYSVREEPGVQTPSETLQKRTGSCRDFALLFMEAARLLGVAARYVSGYLCQTNAEGTLGAASGSTHAWAELFLPGAGWKGFDPTCGALAADYHVRTAVTRMPEQAVPVGGTFKGKSESYLGMQVQVHASRVKDGTASS